jgi:sporulation protein YlmC with PRC-barrel domain
MLFSEGTGQQVVSTETAQTVGKVKHFVVDPVRRQVVALTLKKTDHGDTLRWTDLTAFGADAVTVTSADKITEMPEDVAHLATKDRRLLGRRVLTVEGDEIGSVDDVEFDPATGAVINLIVKDAQIPGVRLVGAGTYAVVVTVD